MADDGFLARKPAAMTFEEAGTVFVGAACSLYFLRRLGDYACARHTLDEIREAHRYANSGHKVGNVAVLIGDPVDA